MMITPIKTTITQELRSRIAPFVMLLDARYLPLLFAASWQSYTVYRWLWEHSHRTGTDRLFAILGGMAFEAVYVGIIAWATSGGSKTRWTPTTLFLALVFSILVAVRMHWATEGAWSLLHAGFPLVGFGYAMVMHAGEAASQAVADQSQEIAELRRSVAEYELLVAGLHSDIAEHEEREAERSQVAADATQTAQQILAEVERQRDMALRDAAELRRERDEARRIAAEQARALAEAEGLDLRQIAGALKAGRAMSWSELEAALGRPQSTLRSWVKGAERAQTNGHLIAEEA